MNLFSNAHQTGEAFCKIVKKPRRNEVYGSLKLPVCSCVSITYRSLPRIVCLSVFRKQCITEV